MLVFSKGRAPLTCLADSVGLLSSDPPRCITQASSPLQDCEHQGTLSTPQHCALASVWSGTSSSLERGPPPPPLTCPPWVGAALSAPSLHARSLGPTVQPCPGHRGVFLNSFRPPPSAAGGCLTHAGDLSLPGLNTRPLRDMGQISS